MDNQRPSRVCTLFATATWVCRSATAHNVDTDRRGPRLETLTGLPVRSTPRLPHEPQPHPKSDVLVGTPMTAKSVAKLALGIADNQALTVLCECVATVPMIIFPRVNAAHARQPAWNDHLDRLRTVGVELIYGEHVWPLAAGTAGPRELPWAAIDVVSTFHTRFKSRLRRLAARVSLRCVPRRCRPSAARLWAIWRHVDRRVADTLRAQ